MQKNDIRDTSDLFSISFRSWSMADSQVMIIQRLISRPSSFRLFDYRPIVHFNEAPSLAACMHVCLEDRGSTCRRHWHRLPSFQSRWIVKLNTLTCTDTRWRQHDRQCGLVLIANSQSADDCWADDCSWRWTCTLSDLAGMKCVECQIQLCDPINNNINICSIEIKWDGKTN